MEPTIYEQFSELIRMPHGIVLVTGPTGSGKTTTLYSSLIEIKRRRRPRSSRPKTRSNISSKASTRFRCIRRSA